MSEKERLQLENELLMTCSKAQAINKYIDELEESSKLSELWCKSQEENRKLKEVIDKLNFIKNRKNQGASQESINKMAIEFVNSYLKEVE